jgi:hypothetical protein
MSNIIYCETGSAVLAVSLDQHPENHLATEVETHMAPKFCV